jgi:hypothetical protein
VAQILTLKLPAGTSTAVGEALERDIRLIAEVKAAGVQHTRGLDAATIAVWLSIAKPAADIAMDVVKRIIDIIRGKGMTGVVIELPDGAGSVKADYSSASDLEKLLKAVRGPA